MPTDGRTRGAGGWRHGCQGRLGAVSRRQGRGTLGSAIGARTLAKLARSRSSWAMGAYRLSEGFREDERGEIVALLCEYERAIGVSLCFQDFAAEIAGLPGAYAPPGGTLILARQAPGLALAGCVALRPGAADGGARMMWGTLGRVCG